MLENKKKYGEWTSNKKKTDRKLCFHCHSFLNKNKNKNKKKKEKREEKI